jgi:regulator of sirC expression with transglutaminase-like and TPR domain
MPVMHNYKEKEKYFADQILTAKQKNPDADTSELENKIDQMVYKLYGLTDDEIEIVEGEDKMRTISIMILY